jgi:hypothetical protein
MNPVGSERNYTHPVPNSRRTDEGCGKREILGKEVSSAQEEVKRRHLGGFWQRPIAAGQIKAGGVWIEKLCLASASAALLPPNGQKSC